MGAAIRTFDWSTTSLGPISSWPQPLRTAVNLCLNSRFAMFIWWGPDLINLYNDAYISVLGRRHPDALGRGAADLWADVWPIVALQVQHVFERGEASFSERLRIVIDRNGNAEEAYFTYSHSPIFDEHNGVGGLICVVVEETQQVLAERRLAFLVEISDRLGRLSNPQQIMSVAVETLGRHLNASRISYGQLQPDGETIVVQTSYTNGVDPITGAIPLASFGSRNVTSQHRGVADVQNDVRADRSGNLEFWELIETRSSVSVPLVRDGRLRAGLYVHQRDVRFWAKEDVALIEDVAVRLWEVLERARAEEQLRRSERRQALLLELMQGQRETSDTVAMMVAAVEVVGRFLEAGRAGFFLVREDGSLDLKAGWTAGRQPQLKGVMPATALGERYWQELIAGRTFHVSNTEADAAAAGSIFSGEGTLSVIGSPVMRNGRLQAGMFVTDDQVRDWTEGDVSFVYDVADRTWDATERAQSEKAKRKSEEGLRFALEAGGGVGTWDYDVPNDRLYCDERFARLFSVDAERAAVGAPVSEFIHGVHPDDMARVAEKVQQAILTGGEYAEEYRVTPSNSSLRWLFARGRGQLDAEGAPLRFTGVVFDITEQKMVARRHALLVQMDDAVRPLTDPRQITSTVAKLLGEHLEVNRCAYANVEDDQDTFNLTGDFNRGVESIVGRYAFRQFGRECLRMMREGRAFVVEDSEIDPRTEDVRDSFRMTSIVAVICVPMLKQGRLVAAMAVHKAEPRKWQPEEVELVQQVASRCWESIERARVAWELQQREQRYRFLAESIPQMVWTATPDGQLDYVSQQVAHYFGVDSDEVLGSGWLRWVHPEDEARGMERWLQSIATGQSYETEFRLRREEDGSWRWHLVRALPLIGEGGQVVEWFGTCTDIEDQKQAEVQLRQQWLTFDTVLSHTPDFAYIFDLKGRFTYVNYALLSLWRMSFEEAVGKDFFELGYPPELAGKLCRQIQQVIDTKDYVRDQTPFTDVEGNTRHYEYIFVPVLSASGQVEAVAGSTRDITDRDRIEKALAASEERLQQIFAQAPVAIGVFRGRDFVTEIANPSYQVMLQNPPIVGRRLAESVPELSPNVWEAFHKVFDTGEPFVATDFPIPYDQDGDGAVEDHWFNVVYHPLRDREGAVSGIVAVCSDVTVQVRARKELERVNRELEEFAYVASHDLQEPLRMVNIYTQLLLRRFIGDNPEARQFAALVRQGVMRMEALIGDLLTFSRTVQRIETPIGTADLAQSLTTALSVLKNRIEESGAAISADALPTVKGETAQMSHVFQNLLSNSLKYRKTNTRPEIRISARNEGGEWIVSIEDNGIGFEQQYAERIFGLFKRLHKEEYPGTGLGLAICQRIIERYGGRLWAEGRPGVGSIFHFALPIVESRSS